MNTPKYIAGLDTLANFVLWRLDPAPPESKTGKLLKVPVHTEWPWENHSVNKPQAMASAATVEGWRAHHIASGKYHDDPKRPGYLGIGFRPEGTGLACLDIDDCILPGSPPTWSPLADRMLRTFLGAGAELSTSGTGLHLWFRYECESPGKRPRNPTNELELYASGQFIALGTPIQGDANTVHTVAMQQVLAEFWPARSETPEMAPAEWTTAPVEGFKKPWDKARFFEEIAKPITRNSAGRLFAGMPDLATMWNAPADEVVAHYQGDRSKARMGLLGMLMWRFGGNCEAIHEICQGHDLAQKDGREKLLQTEILRAYQLFAASFQASHEREIAQKEETRIIGEGLGEAITPSLLSLDEMTERMVYVAQSNGVVDSKDSRAFSWVNALGNFAASEFTITTEDARGKPKEKTLPCLPTWLKNPQRKTVDVLTWAPGHAEFCLPPEPKQGQTRAYNLWKGLRPYEAPEDWAQRVQPFLGHIEYLVPLTAQRERFIQWLAHIVQRPGELPHTGYLMIADTVGVGRNWLAAVLARVLSGYMASGIALGPVLDGDFNGRLSGKLLATVDETREGLSDNRYVRAEALKRVITEEYRHINPKYGVQSVEFNCCRWLMFSNHTDALPLDKMDRRIEVIANPDWVRDAAYYSDLYPKRDDARFIASVRHYLQTLDLSGFNPGAHAVMSEAKMRAVAAVTPETDKALQAIRDEWKGDFITRARLMRAVQEYTGDPYVKQSAVEHAMRRFGWTTWSGRPRVKGMRSTLISMNPLIGEAEMNAAGMRALVDATEASETTFDTAPSGS